MRWLRANRKALAEPGGARASLLYMTVRGPWRASRICDHQEKLSPGPSAVSRFPAAEEGISQKRNYPHPTKQ